MKVKVQFCESWFKTKNGDMWYKLHFQLNDKETAWVPSPRNFPVGTEVVLACGRDKDGRAKLTLAH